MKRLATMMLVALLAASTLQGCYGKMALTRKVYHVNGEVKDKYLRSFVSWVFIIVPVYGISALADFVVFNTIEFWSGKNPVAQGEKDFTYADNGESYRVHATKNGPLVSYRIDHYCGDKHLDRLAINWDTRSGNSTASMTAPEGVTDYAAFEEHGGVKVTSVKRGERQAMPEAVALFR